MYLKFSFVIERRERVRREIECVFFFFWSISFYGLDFELWRIEGRAG